MNEKGPFEFGDTPCKNLFSYHPQGYVFSVTNKRTNKHTYINNTKHDRGGLAVKH